MKLSIPLSPATIPPRKREAPRRAFTLTELLVVIATVTVLGMLMLPALAGVQTKSGRVQCANNLRQVGIATMIYAGESSTWLPIWGGTSLNPRTKNAISSSTYARYVTLGGPTNTKVPTNSTWLATGGTFENLGYLYETGLAGNGQIFYCPDQWGTPFGADLYSPLLTSSAINGSGSIRSSYYFNPHINPSSNVRLYQKTSQLEPHKLLAVDYADTGTMPYYFAHFRERGWNVLFTDGGVNFSRSDQAYNFLSSGARPANPADAELNLWNLFEQDH